MIGLLPCAGKAERLYGLPKFLLPCPDGYLLKRHYDAMIKAGCKPVGISTNESHYELLKSYGYYPTRLERYSTMSETLLETYYERIVDLMYDQEDVLFGMPDSYFDDPYLYDFMNQELLEYPDIQVVAGLFVVSEKQAHLLGMCELAADRRIVRIVDKPVETTLRYAWGCLAWRPSFWQYIQPEDAHVGFALQRAIEDSVLVKGLFSPAKYYDCGTWAGYAEMVRDTTA